MEGWSEGGAFVSPAGGITLTHYCSDRGSWFIPHTRLWRARHEFYISRAFTDPDEAWKQSNLDWVFVTGCGCHDAGNAGMWGGKDLLDDLEGDTKTAFKVLRALRDGYSTILKYLPMWLATVQFVPRKYDYHVNYMFYTALGLEPELVEWFSLADFRFEGGNLYCSEHLRDAPDILTEIADKLLAIFMFRPFTKGRFCSMEEGSRRLCASLAVGLDALVAFCLKQPHARKWYLGKFSLLDVKLRWLAKRVTALR